LRSFPADIAPGRSGLRLQHLRETTATGEADALFQHLASLIDLLSQGQACPVANAAFAGASLIALLKPGTGRAATGMTLTPLTAKCLMADSREMARRHIWRARFGVAVTSTLQFARSVGLTFNLERHELVSVGATLSAPQTANFTAQLLTDMHGKSCLLRVFDLLVAATGIPDIVAGHTIPSCPKSKGGPRTRNLLDGLETLQLQCGVQLALANQSLRAGKGHQLLQLPWPHASAARATQCLPGRSARSWEPHLAPLQVQEADHAVARKPNPAWPKSTGRLPPQSWVQMQAEHQIATVCGGGGNH